MGEDKGSLFIVGFLEGRLVEDGLEEKAYLRIGESLRVCEGAAEEECEGETVASTTSLCTFCAAVGLTAGLNTNTVDGVTASLVIGVAVGLTVGAYVGVTVDVGLFVGVAVGLFVCLLVGWMLACLLVWLLA